MAELFEKGVIKNVDFDISIDGIIVKVIDPTLMIDEAIKSAGVNIATPCFGDDRKFGNCKVCLVEIDKKLSYACRKKTKKGMRIFVDREDLNALREERLEIYKKKQLKK